MAGIYVHIPFCRQACHYCDFHFSTSLSSREAMVDAMVLEIRIRKDYVAGEKIKTIYFGGGTPSLLTHFELEKIIQAIHESFDTSGLQEMTIEANPDDLTDDVLRSLKMLGFNRLSIGIQTFNDDLLQYLNRVHDRAASIRCVEAARATGFENISVDLIYAIPGLSASGWKENIAKALELRPEHISAYSLTIEPKTVFGKWVEKGRVEMIPDEVAAQQLEELVALLGDAGYDHYEVSNFALPGFESRHNSSYWRQEMYLGIGPSAHSFNGTSREFNINNNQRYIKAITAGNIPSEKETLSNKDAVNEYLMTRLRTSWGADMDWLKTRYGVDILTDQHSYIHTLISEKMASLDGHVLKLTERGRLLADKIAADLFLIR